MYSCTLHYTVCKHIHLIHMSLDGSGSSEVVEGIEQSEIEHNTDVGLNESQVQFNSTDYFSQILQSVCVQTTSNCNLVSLRNSAEVLSQKLHSLVQACDVEDTLKTVNGHLQSAISILEAKKHYAQVQMDAFVPVMAPTPNARHEQQMRFHSTKKKRRTTKTRIAKPSPTKENEARGIMENTDVRVCGVCWKEEDRGNTENVLWIECDSCGLWLHVTCSDTHLTTCN